MHGFMSGVNISGTCDIVSCTLLRSYIHSCLGRGTSHTVYMLGPLGVVVSGCPTSGARRVSISVGPGGPRLNGAAIRFSGRVCVRRSSFVLGPPNGCFHLYPRGRIHLGNTCCVGCTSRSASRGNGVATIRTACSPRDFNNRAPSNEGIGNALR